VETAGDGLLRGDEGNGIDVFFVECIVDFKDDGDEMGIVNVICRQGIECVPEESRHGEHLCRHGVGNGDSLLLEFAEDRYMFLEMPFYFFMERIAIWWIAQVVVRSHREYPPFIDRKECRVDGFGDIKEYVQQGIRE
jgi:hypothetical protein